MTPSGGARDARRSTRGLTWRGLVSLEGAELDPPHHRGVQRRRLLPQRRATDALVRLVVVPRLKSAPAARFSPAIPAMVRLAVAPRPTSAPAAASDVGTAASRPRLPPAP